MVDTKWDDEVIGKKFIYLKVFNLFLYVKDKIFPLFANFKTVEEEKGADNSR